MIVLLSILITTLIATGVILYILHYLKRKRQAALGLPPEPPAPEIPEECCGQHEVCEKDSLLAAVSKDIEYYDDEELDRFRGTAPDAYTIEETNEFLNIFYTMRSDEVAGWVRSLQLRGIELPEGARDEVLLVVRERRNLS